MIFIRLRYNIYITSSRSQPIFPKEKRLQLIGRSLLGTFSLTVGVFSMRYMPLGDLSMINSTGIFFTCLFARLFLKEAIDKLNLINIVFVIGGVILIVQPPFIFAGQSGIYSKDSLALYSAMAQIFTAVFVHSNVFVLLRSLKGT